jgi:cytochrome c-type biogenesis protein CcmH/NrfF
VSRVRIETAKTRTFVLWIIPAVVVAAAVARVSVWVQPHFAPLVLFPLLVGAALGAILCGLIEIAHLSDARLALVGTMLVALLTALAEHGFFYMDYRAALARKALEFGITEEILTPSTFGEYMDAQAALDDRQTLLWIANAALLALSATGMVLWYMKSQQRHRRSHPDRLPQETANGPKKHSAPS